MIRRADGMRERFPAETLQTLMHAVDIDDVADAEVSLPDPIALDCPVEKMQRCFALCVQLWSDGVHRRDLLRLTNRALRKGDLSEAERLRYTDIRAQYKQLRFALTLYSERHSPPLLFHETVKLMGHLQDGFRNGYRGKVTDSGLRLRGMLTWPVWVAVKRGVAVTRLDSAEGFSAYRKAEIKVLKEALEREMLSGDEFHDMRKIVSSQVSFYDALRSLEPNEHDYKMSRFLAAINGLMGRRHDEIVRQALSGERAYQTPVALDADIRQRLEKLVAHYPFSDDAGPYSARLPQPHAGEAATNGR